MALDVLIAIGVSLLSVDRARNTFFSNKLILVFLIKSNILELIRILLLIKIN